MKKIILLSLIVLGLSSCSLAPTELPNKSESEMAFEKKKECQIAWQRNGVNDSSAAHIKYYPIWYSKYYNSCIFMQGDYLIGDIFTQVPYYYKSKDDGETSIETKCAFIAAAIRADFPYPESLSQVPCPSESL